jgi:DNA-directed RNA polymerase subunit F
MIRYREPLSMTESVEYIEDEKDSEAEIKKFVKKFVKLKPEEAKKMREKLSSLELLKLKQEYISKIIDILPENFEDLNKIFTDVGLDEDEAKKVLDIIDEFR